MLKVLHGHREEFIVGGVRVDADEISAWIQLIKLILVWI